MFLDQAKNLELVDRFVHTSADYLICSKVVTMK